MKSFAENPSRYILLFFLICFLNMYCSKDDGPIDVPGTTNNPPTITSFTPTEGVVGTVVTINGSNFSPNLSENKVDFNGTNAVVTSASTTSIVTSVPQGARSGLISVIVDGRTARKGDFTVLLPEILIVDYFEPTEVFEGSQVVVFGNKFSPIPENNEVSINGIKAEVISASVTELLIIVPEGASSGNISVKVEDKTVASTSEISVLEPKIFFGEDNSSHYLRRSNLDGSEVEELILMPYGAGHRVEAVDVLNSKIYSKWHKHSTGKLVLQSSSLNGKTLSEFDTDIAIPWRFAVSTKPPYLYGIVSIANNEGVNVVTIISVDMDLRKYTKLKESSLSYGSIWIENLDIDNIEGHIYYQVSEEGNNVGLYRMDLDGSNEIKILSRSSDDCGNLMQNQMMNFEKKEMYFTAESPPNCNVTSLYKINLDEENPQPIKLIDNIDAWKYRFDKKSNKIYRISRINDRPIERSNIDGTETEVIHNELSEFFELSSN